MSCAWHDGVPSVGRSSRAGTGRGTSPPSPGRRPPCQSPHLLYVLSGRWPSGWTTGPRGEFGPDDAVMIEGPADSLGGALSVPTRSDFGNAQTYALHQESKPPPGSGSTPGATAAPARGPRRPGLGRSAAYIAWPVSRCTARGAEALGHHVSTTGGAPAGAGSGAALGANPGPKRREQAAITSVHGRCCPRPRPKSSRSARPVCKHPSISTWPAGTLRRRPVHRRGRQHLVGRTFSIERLVFFAGR